VHPDPDGGDVLKWHKSLPETPGERLWCLAPDDFVSQLGGDFTPIVAEILETDDPILRGPSGPHRRIKVYCGGQGLDLKSSAPTDTVKTALLMLFLED
jgi:hypothetical protein